MKLITWNCNMAFRKKFQYLLDFEADVIVVQECEQKSKLEDHLADLAYNEIIWIGNNPHKGTAVITFKKCHMQLSKKFNPAFEYIVPIELSSGKKKINLFAIWAMPHKTERKKDYVGQIWGAIHFYDALLNDASILIGDFNSNTIWDKKSRVGNHSDVVDFLDNKDIVSLYHRQVSLAHGKEIDPTLYLLKKEDRSYHLDYCFASSKLISKHTKITIGKYKDWIKRSDHMPLFVEALG